MFNLETAIAEWRRQMLKSGIQSSEELDELEDHLRDEFEAQARSDMPEETAFETAIRQVGRPETLMPEFAKVREPIVERMKRLWCRIAGISDYQLAMNMNVSNQYFEPRWVTYLKATAFIVPAFFAWAGFCIYVLPKLKEICAQSGMVIWRPVITALNVSDFVRNNLIVLSVALIVALMLLEWRSDWWRRHRRQVFGVAVYGLNILVLVLITTLAVLAVAAGAHLLPGK